MSDEKTAPNGSGTTTMTKRPGSCSHLTKVLNLTGAKLEDLLLKTTARYGSAAKEENDSTGLKRFPKGLGVVYACLQCAEAGSLSHIASHSKMEKHRISVDTRSGCLYCAYCKDAIYDPSVEHFNLYGNPYIDESKKRKFSEALEQDSYITTNSTTTPCSREGVRGLFNLGQTCYMNAVLQSLLHDPVLVGYFLGEGHPASRCEIEDCIGCAMTETFAECRATDRQDGFPALSLLMASWKQMPLLAGYAQQDAHEYYQSLVDKLHESATSTPSNDRHCKCFFHKVFFGTLRSTITCNACGEQRKTDDPFNDLSLHMEIQQAVKKKEKVSSASGEIQKLPPTLESCLDSYVSKEKLVANCKSCGNAAKSATKQLRLRKLPAILCMQMKRFDHSSSASEATKIEGKVDFPLSINMSPYTTNHKATTTTTLPDNLKTPSTSSFPPPRIESERLIYDLTSVIVHKGSLDSGHYYVYCRETPPSLSPFSSSSPSSSSTANTTADTSPDPSTSATTAPTSSSSSSSSCSASGLGQDRWYLFNDDRVTPSSVSEVLAADAYLLFYGLRWLPPRDPNKPWAGAMGSTVRYRVDEESDSE